MEFLQVFTWAKRMHLGWVRVAGISAATLAKHGFVGPRAAYACRFGLCKGYLGEYEAARDCSAALAGIA